MRQIINLLAAKKPTCGLQGLCTDVLRATQSLKDPHIEFSPQNQFRS